MPPRRDTWNLPQKIIGPNCAWPEIERGQGCFLPSRTQDDLSLGLAIRLDAVLVGQ